MQPQNEGPRRRQRIVAFSVLAVLSAGVCVLNVTNGDLAGHHRGTAWALLGFAVLAVTVILLIPTVRRKID